MSQFQPSEVWAEFEKIAAEEGLITAPILSEAHPGGGTNTQGIPGDTRVEDLKEQQQADLAVALKNPTGVLASAIASLQKEAADPREISLKDILDAINEYRSADEEETEPVTEEAILSESPDVLAQKKNQNKKVAFDLAEELREEAGIGEEGIEESIEDEAIQSLIAAESEEHAAGSEEEREEAEEDELAAIQALSEHAEHEMSEREAKELYYFLKQAKKKICPVTGKPTKGRGMGDGDGKGPGKGPRSQGKKVNEEDSKKKVTK